jgi:hypothetical protein
LRSIKGKKTRYNFDGNKDEKQGIHARREDETVRKEGEATATSTNHTPQLPEEPGPCLIDI